MDQTLEEESKQMDQQYKIVAFLFFFFFLSCSLLLLLLLLLLLGLFIYLSLHCFYFRLLSFFLLLVSLP